MDLELVGWAIYCGIPIFSLIGLMCACICGGRDCEVQKCFSISLYICMWYYVLFGITGLDQFWYGTKEQFSTIAPKVLIPLIWMIHLIESRFSNVRYYFTEMGSRNNFDETLSEVRSTNPIITFRIGN